VRFIGFLSKRISRNKGGTNKLIKECGHSCPGEMRRAKNELVVLGKR
jgi:hypothetical protein